MIELFANNLPLLVGFVFIFGLLVGSFLNVVIHRLPIMLNREWKTTATEILTEAHCKVECPADPLPNTYNLVVPRSTCPSCNHEIKALENIPVISWLFLKGQCSNCKNKISARYPVIELLTAMSFAVCAYTFGLNWNLAFALVFTAYLICGSLIDFDHKILPDILTLPLIWIGLLAAIIINPQVIDTSFAPDLTSAVLGGLLGYMSLWSFYWLFKLITGKDGMGHGDFKLLAAIGAFVGYQLLPLVILLSTLTGAILGIVIISKKGRDFKIPFGPFLSIAGWVALLYGRPITEFYIQLLHI